MAAMGLAPGRRWILARRFRPLRPSAIASSSRAGTDVHGSGGSAVNQNLLTGDGNIGNQVGASTQNNGAADYRFGANATANTASGCTTGYILAPAAFGGAAGAWAWPKHDMHQKSGNIGICDGSVQTASVRSEEETS